MRDLIIKIFIVCSLLTLNNLPAFAQTNSKARSRLSLEYHESPDKTKSIKASLKVKKDSYEPLEGGVIYFYNILDTLQITLDTVKTNSKGEAKFLLEEEFSNYQDSTGILNFMVEFPGDSITKEDDADIQIKPMDLNISFLQEDSIKYIFASAKSLDPQNSTSPIQDLNISIFIKGTFSLLKIGEQTTDELGMIKHEFPVDMPGDTAGVISIVAKVMENDDYGNVESMSEINWGRITPPIVIKHRGLGDTDAPLWMVYTLIILLSAVWFHYLYVLIMLIKIRLAEKTENL